MVGPHLHGPSDKQERRPHAGRESTSADTPRLRGGGLGELRGHNRAAVLRALLDAGALSRTDLRDTVGLSPSVLSYISAELLGAGLVAEHAGAGAAPAARQRRGRQPIPLSIAEFGAASRRCAVSVHIGATRIATSLVDLRARLIAQRNVPLTHVASRVDPVALAKVVTDAAVGLLSEQRVPRSAVVGAGVGLPGWVDSERGVVRRQPQLGWTDVSLADLLASALDVPVVVDEHVRAMAAAEAWFGHGRDAETLSLLFIGAEVGCSHVSGRQVHHGHHAAAGMVGFLPVWPAGGSGETERPASTHAGPTRSSLEAAVSESALLELARRRARRAPDSLLARWAAQVAAGGAPNSNWLAAQVERTGDPAATALLRRRAAELAPFVAHVLGTFDPELLVVAGAIARDPGRYQLRLLEEAIVAHAPDLGERLPALKPSSFGQQTLAVSAGALVLRELYTPPLAANGMARVSGEIRRRVLSPRPA